MAGMNLNAMIGFFNPDEEVGNVGPRWTLWLENLEAFLALSSVDDKPKKLNYLKVLGGIKLQKVLKALNEVKIEGEGDDEADVYKKAMA